MSSSTDIFYIMRNGKLYYYIIKAVYYYMFVDVVFWTSLLCIHYYYRDASVHRQMKWSSDHVLTWDYMKLC
jgi:uncharacterized membrane protein YcgQ (UPF0703/DUF1980 family)